MTNIKYALHRLGNENAAGITDLKESIGHPLDPNCCTILLCTAGMATVSTNFQKRIMKKGDAVFIFTDIVFVTIEVSDTFSALYVSLSEEVMEEVFYKITPTSFWYFIYDHVILHLSENQFMLLHTWYQQTKWIIDECAQEYKLTLLRNNIHSLFMAIDSEAKEKNIGINDHYKRDQTWAILGKFASLLAEHCHQHREVSFYADKLCITPDYLYKLAYKGIEQSPKEIIEQMIIVEIKTYLSNTNLSIKSIAGEMNFEDPSYMCRFFRRHTGSSPTEYRNIYLK